MTTIQDDAELKSLINTRRTLHGIAECLLAGPEHRASGEIALRVVPGGFATAAGPDVKVRAPFCCVTSAGPQYGLP